MSDRRDLEQRKNERRMCGRNNIEKDCLALPDSLFSYVFSCPSLRLFSNILFSMTFKHLLKGFFALLLRFWEMAFY